MSYGRDRLNATNAITHQYGEIEKSEFDLLLEKPFVPLVTSDFELLMQQSDGVRKLTKLDQREIIETLLLSHGILVDQGGEKHLNKNISAQLLPVLGVILKGLGGRLFNKSVQIKRPCRICRNPECYLSTVETRWIVEWF